MEILFEHVLSMLKPDEGCLNMSCDVHEYLWFTKITPYVFLAQSYFLSDNGVFVEKVFLGIQNDKINESDVVYNMVKNDYYGNDS